MHELSLHILDLIENSLRAKATVVAILLQTDPKSDLLRIKVDDNGEGLKISPEDAVNPFCTTKRAKRVGLGLSFFKETAEMAEGGLWIFRSNELGGTTVEVAMRLTHVNRPPLGDLAGTLSVVIATHPNVDFVLTIRANNRDDSFRLSEFARANGIDANANVELASRASQEIGARLRTWNQAACG